MLIRCTKCGKPVFYTPGFRRIECGYCYAMITEAGESPRQLLPSESDWMGPLLEHIGSLPLKDADPDWTALLKDGPLDCPGLFISADRACGAPPASPGSG